MKSAFLLLAFFGPLSTLSFILLPLRTIKKSHNSILCNSRESDHVPDDDLQDTPQEMQKMIDKEMQENGPSELEVRMNLLGLTPWTVTGFVLAGVIIALNNVLGYGWASELLGLDPTVPLQIQIQAEGGDKDHRREKSGGTINNDVLNLDEKLREVRDTLTPIEIEY